MPTSDPVDSGPDGSFPPSNNSPAIHSDAPLPSTSTPCGIACACLNVQIAGRVPDDLLDKVHAGPSAFEHDSRHQVWLPSEAEKIVRIRRERASHRDSADQLGAPGPGSIRECQRKQGQQVHEGQKER